ncbi:MAG: hypothetical protein SGI74_03175 [Oligoflexia bacterium]|nr:hypothetical protein [Oligoflexia bacterium]
MIKDLLFVIKMLGLTVIVALAFQTKFGDKSVEEEFHHWIKTSVFVDLIQEAVDGGVVLTRAGYKSADTNVRKILSKLSKRREDKKDRSLGNFELKRHNDGKEDDEDLEEIAPRVKSSVPHPR